MVNGLNEMVSPHADTQGNAAWEMPTLEGVERTKRTIQGPSGNDLTLAIHRPAENRCLLPCVFHIHGGLWNNVHSKPFAHWRDELALRGLAVIGITRRNPAPGNGVFHSFSEINADVLTNLEYVIAHKAELGIERVVVNGESMGGKLALALAIKLKTLGKLSLIDGMYVQCPYLSGRIEPPDPRFPSLIENAAVHAAVDGMGRAGQAAGVFLVEGPSASPSDRQEPLCWPDEAHSDQLAGLPPTVISVNELDVLRDVGLNVSRKLRAAKVRGYAVTQVGTDHGAEVYRPWVTPDAAQAVIRDISNFVKSL